MQLLQCCSLLTVGVTAAGLFCRKYIAVGGSTSVESKPVSARASEIFLIHSPSRSGPLGRAECGVWVLTSTKRKQNQVLNTDNCLNMFCSETADSCLTQANAIADAAHGLASADSIDEDSINSLNTRISRAQPVRLPEDTEPSISPVTGPDDTQLAASLNQRLKELSVSSVDDITEPCTGEARLLAPSYHALAGVRPATDYHWTSAGETLRALIEEKYGKTYGTRLTSTSLVATFGVELASGSALQGTEYRAHHVRSDKTAPWHADLSIVRRHIPGKMLVALNVMWTHLGQQSFPMSEEEYMDKLDTIAYYLR